MLADKYPEAVRKIISKYPPEQKRSAVMPLLYLAQRDEGFVTKAALEDIAQMLDITSTNVAEIVGFYTLYHDRKGGKYRMQVCTDLPCALRGADKFLEELCGNLGVKVGETTSDGMVTIEAVMCLAGCDKAPTFQVQGPEGIAYHENMTMDKTMELVAALRKSGKEVK
jgi:NADH-quinone oxidoreductase E subunit